MDTNNLGPCTRRVPLGESMTTLEKILVPAAEAAALLSMGKSTFWREVAKGVIPEPIKIGGLTRWRVSDLHRFVQPTTHPTTP